MSPPSRFTLMVSSLVKVRLNRLQGLVTIRVIHVPLNDFVEHVGYDKSKSLKTYLLLLVKQLELGLKSDYQ
jgi:hypothetical protein